MIQFLNGCKKNYLFSDRKLSWIFKGESQIFIVALSLANSLMKNRYYLINFLLLFFKAAPPQQSMKIPWAHQPWNDLFVTFLSFPSDKTVAANNSGFYFPPVIWSIKLSRCFARIWISEIEADMVKSTNNKIDILL